MQQISSIKPKQLRLLDWILVFILLFSSIYNAENKYVRLFVVILLFLLPLVFYIKSVKFESFDKFSCIKWISFLWLFYMVVWGINNINNINMNFDGPNVEMFTPILFFTTLYTIPIIKNYDLIRLKVIVNRFIVIYLILLLLDMIWRYISEPYCFINYSCRFEAKTVGYFSTTNALGTSLAVVMISLLASGISLKKMGWIYSLILITTMARAAIIATFLGYLFIKITSSTKKERFVFLFSGVTITLTMLVYDPFKLMNDGSGLSKIDFFLASIELAKTTDLQILLFGFGANFESITYILGVNDWSPHVPILKALLYFGLIGVFLHLFYLFGIVKLQKNMIYPVLVFLILGLAGAPLYFPTFLTCFAILRTSKF
jgi:hypothetical protein